MKIFIITHSLTGGGAERVAINLANGLTKRGHAVTLFTDLHYPVTYQPDDHVRVYPLCRNKSHKLIKWLHAIRIIRKGIKEEHPDAIIGMMHLCSLIGRTAAAFLPVPVVLTIHHAVGHRKVRYSWITRFADQWMPMLFPCVTVLSERDKQFYHRRKNIMVMYNPLTFSPVSLIPPKEKIILAAGRLSAVYIKGWDLLIQAWSMIANQYPDWQLVIVGGGSDEDENIIQKMLFERNVSPQTLLAGYQQDILPWYQRAAIFVLSSRSEGQPMVLLEAMSQGCAPIATDNDNRTQEIITASSEGIICQTDALSIARALSRLLADSILRTQLQQGAVLRSFHYSSEQVAKRWEHLLESLTQQIHQ